MRKPIQREREIEIGKRLRAFREGLKIPRTVFALSIGVGGERLASYEVGRVPLRYGVFEAIAKQYRLNPVWLGKGEGEPSLRIAFDFTGLVPIPAAAVFSQIYDEYLDKVFSLKGILGEQVGRETLEVLQAFLATAKISPHLIDPSVFEKLARMIPDLIWALPEERRRDLMGKSLRRVFPVPEIRKEKS